MPESIHNALGKASGGCLCGDVRYQVTGPLRDIVCCHCSQCRRTSGNFVAASQVNNDHLEIISGTSLHWYASSAEAERGFCKGCGGNLFWRKKADDRTSIMAGTLDLPTRLTIKHHIYVSDASDYVCFHANDVIHEQDV